jgi:hypothetical protein
MEIEMYHFRTKPLRIPVAHSAYGYVKERKVVSKVRLLQLFWRKQQADDHSSLLSLLPAFQGEENRKKKICIVIVLTSVRKYNEHNQ